MSLRFHWTLPNLLLREVEVGWVSWIWFSCKDLPTNLLVSDSELGNQPLIVSSVGSGSFWSRLGRFAWVG